MNFCHYIYCNGRERWFLKGYSNCEPQFAWTLNPDEAIRFYRLLEATAVMQVIVHKTSANIKLLEVPVGGGRQNV